MRRIRDGNGVGARCCLARLSPEDADATEGIGGLEPWQSVARMRTHGAL